MSITPLPVFEADADPRHRSARSDQEIYESLEPPTSIVVRFGSIKLVGEYPYNGDAKPGCGSKLVVRTHRGTEIGEMLTSTCPNAGCSKSVTRQEMLDYIENSGGHDYPFHTNGRIIRVATIDDLNAQSALDSTRREAVQVSKEKIAEFKLPMKLVEVEPILGGELLTFYYMSEERVDFRELVKQLASQFKTRIEMRQVGARDEARLVADYERCGQHCCCKNFLKVLKPVSMSAAKRQKATLEPLKISGRCGRLMCCLRYEDQTYKDLKANLPRRKSRVGTAEGPGMVLDSKVLVQLVLVKLEFDGKEIAVPVEELMDPETCPPPGTKPEEPDPLRGMPEVEVEQRTDDRKRKGRGPSRHKQQDSYREQSQQDESREADAPQQPGEAGDRKPSKRRRGGKRRRRGRKGDPGQASPRSETETPSPKPEASGESGGGSERKKTGSGRRRGGRRRRRGRRGNDQSGGGSGQSESG